MDFPIENGGSFNSYVNVYQRVYDFGPQPFKKKTQLVDLVGLPLNSGDQEKRTGYNSKSTYPDVVTNGGFHTWGVSKMAALSMENPNL